MTSTQALHGLSGKLLRLVLLFSLAVYLFSFIVLGHIDSTLPLMYALSLAGLAGYTLARGPRNTLESFLEYLGSETMLLRWAFLALAALSLLWSSRTGGPGGGSGLNRMMTLFLIQISGWMVYDAVRRLGEFDNAVRIVFYSAAIGALIALLDIKSMEGYRIRGYFGNPNSLAIAGTLGLLAFVAYLSTIMPRWEKVSALLLVVVLHIAVFASGSRKGIAGLAYIWLIGLALRRTRRSTLAIVGLAFAVGLTAFNFAPRPLKAVAFRNLDRLGAIFVQSTTSATVDYSTVLRARFIERGLALMTEAPIFGHGLDAFRLISGEGTYAHNNYIDLGVGVGVIGLIIYYGWLFTLIYGLASLLWRGDPRAGQIAVFGLAVLGLILLIDVAAVSYMSKIVSLVPVLLAAELDARRRQVRVHWSAW